MPNTCQKDCKVSTIMVWMSRKPNKYGWLLTYLSWKHFKYSLKTDINWVNVFMCVCLTRGVQPAWSFRFGSAPWSSSSLAASTSPCREREWEHERERENTRENEREREHERENEKERTRTRTRTRDVWGQYLEPPSLTAYKHSLLS